MTDWRDHETREVPFNGLLASGSGVAAGGGYSVPGGPWNVAAYRSTAIRVDGNGTLATVEVTWVGDAGGPSIPSKETKVATIDPCTLFFQNQGHTITSILITAGAGTSYEVLESNQLPLASATAGGGGGAIAARAYSTSGDAGQVIPSGPTTFVTPAHFEANDPSFTYDALSGFITCNTAGLYLVRIYCQWPFGVGGSSHFVAFSGSMSNDAAALEGITIEGSGGSIAAPGFYVDALTGFGVMWGGYGSFEVGMTATQLSGANQTLAGLREVLVIRVSDILT